MTTTRARNVSRDDVERVVLLVPAVKKMEPAIVLTKRKPFDRKKVLAALLPDAKEEKVGDKVVFTSAKMALSTHWIDSHTLLVGHPESVRAMLMRRDGNGAAEVKKAGEEGKSHLPPGQCDVVADHC